MNKIFSCLLWVMTMANANAQTFITVLVKDKDTKEALSGANVYWAGTRLGVAASIDGLANVPPPQAYPSKLVVSYIGYLPDTILFAEFKARTEVFLSATVDLEIITVTARRKDQFVRTMDPLKTEVISQSELRKAACCNLSESFQTNASANINYEDAVTGAKQIELLGLRGLYAQNTIDNTPSLRGLSVSYGLDNIPAPWIESISVAKGAPSVRAGYEGITGSINVAYKKPHDIGKLYLDIFANHTGRIEGNWMSAIDKGHWGTAFFANGAMTRDRNDRNDDSFYDQPEVKQVNLMNLWEWRNEKIESQFLIKGLHENRQSGQLAAPFGSGAENGRYGIGINTTRIEGYAKTGILLPGLPEKSLGITASGFYHQQDSYFGLKSYNGKQGSFFANAVYQGYVRNTNHSILAGASLMYDQYDEEVNRTRLQRKDIIPGIAAEYTYKYLDKITLVTGVRIDKPNRYKVQVNPRWHFRYAPKENTTIRLAAGRGFRIPNIYAENVFIFASSRDLAIFEQPDYEAAWNMGLSILQKFQLFNRPSSFNIDYFHTRFTKQVIVDIDNGMNMVHIYNLDGPSFSNSFLAEWNYEPVKGFDVKLAYRLEDVRITMMEGLLQRSMLSPHRGLAALSYKTDEEKWMFSTNVSIHGRHRFPVSFDGDEQRYSPPFAIWGAQITRYQGNWEVFFGGENILNVRQNNPIVGADNPFGNNFDTYQVWGPVVGPIVFGGIRMQLEQKEHNEH
jgi:outer membrane receptor for ferrienterochelin and colicins